MRELLKSESEGISGGSQCDGGSGGNGGAGGNGGRGGNGGTLSLIHI